MRLLFAIAVVALSFGITSAEAAKRVALVIGNDSYKSLPELNNARTDARGISSKLKELGWSVILKQNASRRDISRSLAEFEGLLKEAEVGLVFYAGHGIQKDGTNYLVPSDAQIEAEEDLRYEGIKAGDFLEIMEISGAPLNIVILDACRDNPLPKRTRSSSRGLGIQAIPQGIKGTAILYSAAPGQVAQDGLPGGHGVFTGELLKVLDRPGLKLEEVFKETASKVAAATNGGQDPWMNSSVKGDFYFRGDKAAPVASGSAVDKEMVFWQSIAYSDDPNMFEAYLAQYPDGNFKYLAKARIAALKGPEAASAQPQGQNLASLNPKAKQRPDIELWAGKTFELENDGVYQLNLKFSSDGKTYTAKTSKNAYESVSCSAAVEPSGKLVPCMTKDHIYSSTLFCGYQIEISGSVNNVFMQGHMTYGGCISSENKTLSAGVSIKTELDRN